MTVSNKSNTNNDSSNVRSEFLLITNKVVLKRTQTTPQQAPDGHSTLCELGSEHPAFLHVVPSPQLITVSPVLDQWSAAILEFKHCERTRFDTQTVSSLSPSRRRSSHPCPV